MVKVITIFSLREGCDVKDTLRVWREQHMPDIRKRPGLVKYVINWVKEPIRGGNLFGIVELWYKDYESAKGSASTSMNNPPDEFSKRLYHVTRVLVDEVEVPIPANK